MLTYDFPLSPRARTYLKFESIFKKIDNNCNAQDEAQINSLLRGVVDYMDLVDGSGAIKIEILKDLDKISNSLKSFESIEDVDSDFLQKLKEQLKISFDSLDKFTRQRTVLQHDPIIECIKPRFLTPCGVNCFDTPLFTYWSQLPLEQRHVNINTWLAEMENLRVPICTILYMWRLCAQFQERMAVNGFMKENANNSLLVQIRYPKSVLAYPVLSGFQSSINVRFFPYNKNDKIGDIAFEIAYIKGNLQ